MKTEVMFFFDTEDFTSESCADSVKQLIHILDEEGVTGHFAVVGLVADSVDRRWIVRATTALLVLTAASLWFLTWSGHLTLGALFTAAVAFGIARAFSGPAYSSLAPNLVPRESLPTAIAVSSIAFVKETAPEPPKPEARVK